ncbi:MAG: DUF4013 domain-containing protein, partial [Anaerolineae bacterium]|nr:DUF4013 domain-containing protein [Anaerolineae bacterium]
MDYGFAFSFPFKDSDWLKKFLLIGLISLIPVLGWFVLVGYMAQVIQRTINNDAVLLPEIEFGNQLSLGFKLFLVCLVYALPAIVLQMLVYVPSGILTAQANNNNEGLIAAMSALMVCCVGILILYYIFIGFLLPVAMVKVTLEGNFGAGFKFGEILSVLKAGFLNYLVVFLIVMFASSILASVGGLVCGVGLLLTTPYTAVLEGNLFAQAYRAA